MRWAGVPRRLRNALAACITLLLFLPALAGPQECKPEPSDRPTDARFGHAVAMDGDTAIVGVPGPYSAATEPGSAYIFKKDASGHWAEWAALTASDGMPGDEFGHAVAIDGDTAVVGARSASAAYVFTQDAKGRWTESATLTGVGGQAVAIDGDTTVVGTGSGALVFTLDAAGDWTEQGELRPTGMVYDYYCTVAFAGDTVVIGYATDYGVWENEGAADVFMRDSSGEWGRRATLTAEYAEYGKDFGNAVAIDGDTVFVLGDERFSEHGSSEGVAYVFAPDEHGRWAERARLRAPDVLWSGGLRGAVAIDRDVAVAGAPGDREGRGAAYVFARGESGTWRRANKLTASDAGVWDYFGGAVAINGDTAIVGAPWDDDDMGSVYALPALAVVHTTDLELQASDAGADDHFGHAVDIDDDTLVVGAPGHDHGGTGAGSVYVFGRDAESRWTEVQELGPDDTTDVTSFGCSVAIDGDMLVVGSDWSDADTASCGAAHVFRRGADGLWAHDARFVPPEPTTDGRFGRSVAIDGDTVLVGEPGDQPPLGAAHLFTRDAAGDWTRPSRFTGSSVAIGGDTLLVGQPRDALARVYTFGGGVWTFRGYERPHAGDTPNLFSRSSAIEGGWLVIGGPGEGAAYVSVFDGYWQDAAKLAPADQSGRIFWWGGEGVDMGWYAGGLFGWSVAVDAPLIVVGAPWDPEAGSECGAVYAFRNEGEDWVQSEKVLASDALEGDQLGYAVTTDGEIVVAGAPYADGAGVDCGAVHLYSPRRPIVSPHGPNITTGWFPDGTTGRAYVADPTANRGTPPITWSLESGELPVTGGVDADTGRMDGVARAPGVYDFTLAVEDAAGVVRERSFKVTVNELPEITALALPIGILGRPIETQLEVVGGTPELSWDTSAGELPPGLDLAPDTGLLSGTPDEAGHYAFTVRCVDTTGAATERDLALEVVPVMDVSTRESDETVAIHSGDAGGPCRCLELLAGTRLDVTVGFIEPDAPLELVVLDGRGEELDVSGLTRTRRKDIRLRRLVVPATGRYFLRIRATAQFDGFARLAVKVTPPKKATGTCTLAVQETYEFEYGALPNALVTITVRSARKSAALPDILEVTDEQGRQLLVEEELRFRNRKRRAVLRIRKPMRGGRLVVRIRPRFSTSGELKWKVRIRQPKGYEYSRPDLPAGDAQ